MTLVWTIKVTEFIIKQAASQHEMRVSSYKYDSM